jgi:hypothetical protein
VVKAFRDEKDRALAAHHRAVNLHFQGKLTEGELQNAEELNRLTGSALGRRNLCALRGWWFSDAEQWRGAKESLNEAVALARKVGKSDRRSEIRLALSRYHLGEMVEVQQIADQFSNGTDSLLHLPLALLWRAAGDIVQAEVHATEAYNWAWANGEPYVHRYECARARTILTQIGAEVPELPCFSAAQSEVLSWEGDAIRAIEVLKLQQQNEPSLAR